MELKAEQSIESRALGTEQFIAVQVNNITVCITLEEGITRSQRTLACSHLLTVEEYLLAFGSNPSRLRLGLGLRLESIVIV
jgi:hypothetical protein